MCLLDEPFAPEKVGFLLDKIGMYHDRKFTEDIWVSFAYYNDTDQNHRFISLYNGTGEKMVRSLPKMNTVREFYERIDKMLINEWEQPFKSIISTEYRKLTIDEVLESLDA